MTPDGFIDILKKYGEVIPIKSEKTCQNLFRQDIQHIACTAKLSLREIGDLLDKISKQADPIQIFCSNEAIPEDFEHSVKLETYFYFLDKGWESILLKEFFHNQLFRKPADCYAENRDLSFLAMILTLRAGEKIRTKVCGFEGPKNALQEVEMEFYRDFNDSSVMN